MLRHENGIMPAFDERREIGRLLKHLTPKRRLEWLQWCCKQISTPAAETKVLDTDGSVDCIFSGAMSLFWGSGLSMRSAGEKLVEMVKGKQ